jgi:bacterioferritin
MAKRGNKKIIDALNLDRAFELAAIIQYLGHHYEVTGIESPVLEDIFKETSIEEMKHAEALAERIVFLGGTPVQKPGTIKRGGPSRKMIKDDLAIENAAVKRYTAHIKLCEKHGDITTRRLLERILEDEEGHVDTFEALLEKG